MKVNFQLTASTQTALHWAPLKSSVERDNSSKLTSGETFIFREWICMMRARASSFGWGNSILRSKRPERSKAGSKISTRFVAAITWKKEYWYQVQPSQRYNSKSTFMSVVELKPSSWLSNSNMVRCTSRSPAFSESKRFVPVGKM